MVWTFRRPPVLATVAVVVSLVLLTTTGCAAWRIQQSAELARASEAFQATPPKPTASLLIVGDSTAVGTGATSPANSLAGLIARDHPQLRIVNRAQDGAKFAGIVQQLESTDGGEKFDAILVLGGGNDVIRMTRYGAMAQDIARSAQLARTHAGLVVVMPAGNVGNAPFFFPPVSWWMSRRAAALHRFVREAASDNGALFVDLYKDKANDPFAQRATELNAADGLHPNDAGYRVWYEELKAQAGFGQRLSALSAPLAQP